MTADDRIVENIRRRREDLGLRQMDLAHHMRNAGMKWTANTVAQIETGRRRVKPVEAYGLCSIFGISLESLLW